MKLFWLILDHKARKSCLQLLEQKNSVDRLQNISFIILFINIPFKHFCTIAFAVKNEELPLREYGRGLFA